MRALFSLLGIGLGVGIFVSASPAAQAGVESYPVGFRIERIKTGDATLHVRVGGRGPAVVLLHGFGDTGDM